MLQFKIQIKNITKPPVWRRVLVPETFTFHKFHHVIQAAFGWCDCHLYHFTPKGYGSEPQISLPSDDDWGPVVDASKLKLKDVFTQKGQTYCIFMISATIGHIKSHWKKLRTQKP